MLMQKKCMMCPRGCMVDRDKSLGFCKTSNKVRIAKAYLHMWEEPIISCNNGSGTVFFSGCNLRCVYCQNYELSHEAYGIDITIEKLKDIFLK